MASVRGKVIDAVIARLWELAEGGESVPLGSVNRGVRPAATVNDAPSIDVFCGSETREPLASFQARRTLDLWVRIFGRPGDEALLDDVIERVEAVVRRDPTLGGIVIDTFCVGVDTDEGWQGYEGFGPLAQVRFAVRNETTEE